VVTFRDARVHVERRVKISCFFPQRSGLCGSASVFRIANPRIALAKSSGEVSAPEERAAQVFQMLTYKESAKLKREKPTAKS